MTAPPDPTTHPSADRSTALRAVEAADAVHPCAGLTHTLPGGRVIAIEDAAYWTIWTDLEGRKFKSAFDLAKWVGRFYGYHSTIPTSHWITEDGVAWWITNALDSIRLNTLRQELGDKHRDVTMARLVPSGKGVHAPFGTLLARAFAAAGVVVLSVEEASTE